ncbi:unnamed protein product [Polarella glacialis]|uniref:Uncharacterized protein n=2 Tax=Polarella glacialis TaxID=89957 RepID=A0A813FBR3_POLGL|nr:unnamed protein product [Polarella glacialis]
MSSAPEPEQLAAPSPDVQACLLRGARTRTAMGLAYRLAKSHATTFVAWESRHTPSTSSKDLATVLYTVRQDDEDVGDTHVVQTVLSRCEPSFTRRMVVLHVCAENVYPTEWDFSPEGDRSLMESLETGALETRKSLRLVKNVHPLVVSKQAALIFILPHTEASCDSGALGAAAHKTSRVVDQTPLRHESGIPCTFALHPTTASGEVNSALILSWMNTLIGTPDHLWQFAGASTVVTLCMPDEGELALLKREEL